MTTLNEFTKMIEDSIEDSIRQTDSLRELRRIRRADPNWKGCDFCFGTAIGELEDGSEVPCPDCNGLCA